MSSLNSLWLVSAVYLCALAAIALSVGVSTVGGWLTFLLAGSAPMLIALRFWSTPEPILSQHSAGAACLTWNRRAEVIRVRLC